MKKVYVVLSRSGSKFSKMLQFFSKMEYTHVSLSLQEDLSEMYSFGRQNIQMPWIAGFITEQPNTGMYALYNSKCEVLSFDVSDQAYKELNTGICAMKRNTSQYSYNFFGLVLMYFLLEHQLSTKFTCTQFVASALNDAGLDYWEKDASLIAPTDYYLIPGVEIIYRGYINHYAI